MKKKVLELLNDYYGDSRGSGYKEEIADFVRNYSHDLLEILKENHDE